VPTKDESVKLMQDLLKYCPLEEIALEIEKGWYTVWRWSKGRGTPGKGDFELLTSLLKRKESSHISKIVVSMLGSQGTNA